MIKSPPPPHSIPFTKKPTIKRTKICSITSYEHVEKTISLNLDEFLGSAAATDYSPEAPITIWNFTTGDGGDPNEPDELNVNGFVEKEDINLGSLCKWSVEVSGSPQESSLWLRLKEGKDPPKVKLSATFKDFLSNTLERRDSDWGLLHQSERDSLGWNDFFQKHLSHLQNSSPESESGSNNCTLILDLFFEGKSRMERTALASVGPSFHDLSIGDGSGTLGAWKPQSYHPNSLTFDDDSDNSDLNDDDDDDEGSPSDLDEDYESDNEDSLLEPNSPDEMEHDDDLPISFDQWPTDEKDPGLINLKFQSQSFLVPKAKLESTCKWFKDLSQTLPTWNTLTEYTIQAEDKYGILLIGFMSGQRLPHLRRLESLIEFMFIAHKLGYPQLKEAIIDKLAHKICGENWKKIRNLSRACGTSDGLTYLIQTFEKQEEDEERRARRRAKELKRMERREEKSKDPRSDAETKKPRQ